MLCTLFLKNTILFFLSLNMVSKQVWSRTLILGGKNLALTPSTILLCTATVTYCDIDTIIRYSAATLVINGFSSFIISKQNL